MKHLQAHVLPIKTPAERYNDITKKIMEKQKKKKDKKKGKDKDSSSKSKKVKTQIADNTNKELLLENIDEDIELNASNVKKQDSSDPNRSYQKNEVVPVPPSKMPFSPHNKAAKKYNFASELIAENNREESKVNVSSQPTDFETITPPPKNPSALSKNTGVEMKAKPLKP